MIRHEFRPSNRADPHPAAGNRSAGKNKSRGRFEHSESNKENRSGICLNYDRSSSRERKYGREEIVNFQGETQRKYPYQSKHPQEK